MSSPGWTCVWHLDSCRQPVGGSPDHLGAAIRRGADLRVYTEFLFEEHIVAGSSPDDPHAGVIREVIDFRETVLLDDRHSAGITTLRQPIHPPFGFNGAQPMSSFFLYNQDGTQACANLWLDATLPSSPPGSLAQVSPPADMPKMSATTVFDGGSTGPSRNFVYEMEVYRFFVRDDWQELLAHSAEGTVLSGSLQSLEEAQRVGREIKVGIRNFFGDLGAGPEHEVFTLVGSGFYHAGPNVYCALTHPLVRVRPAIPLQYGSQNWDVVWAFLRTDGLATVRRLDPHCRVWSDHAGQFALRWFAR